MNGGQPYCEPEGRTNRRAIMKTTVRRVAGKLADTVREMNEAQQLMLVLRTATDRYAANPDAAPETYQEFLGRTSGVLLHEPSARKRARKSRRS
jgi:hypothetical protein